MNQMNTTPRNLTPAQAKMQGIIGALEKAAPKIKQVAAKHLNPERMLKIVGQALSRNPQLLECTPMSICLAVMRSAELGLEPGGLMQEAHLVPFRNAKNNTWEAQCVVGFQGLIKLARQSGEIETLEAHVVHTGDRFKCTFGLTPVLEHEPKWDGDPGEFMACYAISRLKGGGVVYEVMTKAQVEHVRLKSPQQQAAARSGRGGNSPWDTDFDEMSRKTVIKRLAKYLPKSIELAKAVEADNVLDNGGDAAGLFDADALMPEAVVVDTETGEILDVTPQAPSRTDALKSQLLNNA